MQYFAASTMKDSKPRLERKVPKVISIVFNAVMFVKSRVCKFDYIYPKFL